MYKVQSIIFNKKLYDLNECIIWLNNNGYKINKVDETSNFFRFRQVSPEKLKKEGYKKSYYKRNNIWN